MLAAVEVSARQGSMMPWPFKPLRGKEAKATAAEITRDGRGRCCGECDKPFTAARKPRGVARVAHCDEQGVVSVVAWLLCGGCLGKMKRDGNRLSRKLIGEARAGLALAMMPPGGTA
ncbi:MAG: hypothetical protein HZC22_01470 [Rhodocyclales bacterium]|nr:hypothetical protein [Rhodocyclales bacterium]